MCSKTKDMVKMHHRRSAFIIRALESQLAFSVDVDWKRGGTTVFRWFAERGGKDRKGPLPGSSILAYRHLPAPLFFDSF